MGRSVISRLDRVKTSLEAAPTYRVIFLARGQPLVGVGTKLLDVVDINLGSRAADFVGLSGATPRVVITFWVKTRVFGRVRRILAALQCERWTAAS